MCTGNCDFFERKSKDRFHYCQDCGKRVGESNTYKEKQYGRLRCSCCNGLVRTKYIVYKV